MLKVLLLVFCHNFDVIGVDMLFSLKAVCFDLFLRDSGLAEWFTVQLWVGIGNYHTHSIPLMSNFMTRFFFLFFFVCLV